jgi:hypothetical protein
MALSAATFGDYLNLGTNVVPMVPKSGYTPVKGNLVRREGAQSNEVDVCAVDEAPIGIVMTVGPSGAGITPGICGVALFVQGVHVILPNATGLQPVFDDKIEADAGGMVAVGSTGLTRTRIRTDNTNGVGRVVAINPGGPDTVGVAFEGR